MTVKAMRHPIHSMLGVAAVALLASAAGAGCAEESQGKGAESASDGESRELVGNPAPDFSVAKISGKGGTVSLKRLRGKVVVVDFWGTFCEPCKKSFPKLQELNAKYADNGLEIVAISEDEADDKDKIPAFASEYGAQFTIGWDSDKSVAKHYKPQTMPSTFVIDRQGHVRYVHAGFHEGEEVELDKELKGLLSEK
ncbi:MAG TPA: TlpA disulfide reductase family protein [Polyangiaceae bacterium]|nr:TlpA disulfide reductase family protein [Polyangiaceae bacterium]